MSSIVDKLNLPCRIEEDFIFLKDENKSYTYNEFMKKTVYFASILAENGWKNRAVAVRASHTADTIISFVSILLSGNYYVALSTEAPEAFISRIKEQVTFEIFPEIPEDGIARFSDTDLRCRYEELAQKRQDIKDELYYDIKGFLHGNGFPPTPAQDAYDEVMKQVENFKKYN